ncbi:EscU/YscU/HrcU family type III secretion system export apparatus switch protein (plasmid) [Burkholderia sp. FERM BP-3421]|jgi:type III secretion protein U|uniref:EscU/YscU/HrcU family type III secretion system export apparatus switch protein n=1 Tax=Burkholderia sp. FERM BP-3421 TaxID=1494466 RepID=UPI00235DC439|nr:EscU/YscU/HrcU family type III secretion system export apparatus switch protein [Burkholderia sp. FERM BP-3421]WDD90591.1 EscU/YscU/HrcU family type III secretion system export apparatus switch protein [Burkholderia sp. FERM BP-3421]
MSEKTEQPTAKKRADARRKGQVAKSAEITSGAQLAVLLGYFLFEGPRLMQAFEALARASIDVVNDDLVTALDRWLGVLGAVVARFVIGLALVVIGVTVIAVVAQIGPLLAPEALKPSADKINPIANAKQMFSMKSLFEFAKSLFKVGVLSIIFYYLIREYAPSLQFLPLCSVECGFAVSVRLLYWMWAALIGFYVLFGLADFAFQRYNTTKQLMMSIEDIKQEFKNSEGNPELKHKRKEIHREVQSGSLASNVAKSTVVVRNPTHVAVCLYYDPVAAPLPEVVETGRGKRALHIVALAERAGVPVVENVPVARALAARLAVGQVIPPDLFDPVAHILRLVMHLDYEPDHDDDDAPRPSA